MMKSMFAATRKEELRQELMKNKSIVVKDMSEKLGVSEETIRRDLKILEDEGIVEKTHGGAILKNSVLTIFSKNEHKKLMIENKKAMAEIAAQYVSNGMCIYIDNSTSAFEVVPLISNKNITIVSNSLDVINYCASKPNIKLMCTGGEYDDKYGSFFSSQAINFLNYLNFDIAFLSCRTASIKSGLCEGNSFHSDIKKIAALHSTKIITMIDHTKIDKNSFIKTMDIEETDVLITDLPLNDSWTDFLKQKKVEYRIACNELEQYKYLKERP